MMSGYPGNLTKKQTEALESLKSRLEDVVLPEAGDHYLLKWLRARQFNVNKAENMLKNHLVFREQWNIQSLIDDWKIPEVLDKYMVGGLRGADVEGSPVWYEPFGFFDPRGLVFSSTPKDLMKMKIKVCEEILSELRAQTQKLGRHIDKIIIIFDLANVSLSHIWKPFIDRYCLILQIFEAHYPEMLKRTYVINCPAFFHVGFNLIKPLLSEDTKQKIHILGGNYKDILQEAIGKDLPAHFGGTACDPDGDPRCVSKIRFGGKVPEHYYLKTEFLGEDRLTEVFIGHGSKLDLPYTVDEPGQILKWEFMTKANNIKFAVFYQDSPDTKKDCWEELVPKATCSCHLVPEVGAYPCTRLGTYIVQFDNSYSWVRGKKVVYHIELHKENEGEQGVGEGENGRREGETESREVAEKETLAKEVE